MPYSTDIKQIQKEIKNYSNKYKNTDSQKLISLNFQSGNSNTTRSKSYKNATHKINCGPLNKILEIDVKKQLAWVEPRVTMEMLVKALKPYGLMTPVIPEFKGITVGGAVLGAAAESSSHKYGIFNDTCNSFELLCGDGTLIKATPNNENRDLFYGVPGSYGSLGALGVIELKLIKAADKIHLNYNFFSNLEEAILFLDTQVNEKSSAFLDGIIFSNTSIAIVSANFSSEKKQHLPITHLKSRGALWFFQHVKNLSKQKNSFYEELMPLEDYLFRYDQGAFWMGVYLHNIPFLTRFIKEGILHISSSTNEGFSEKDIKKFHALTGPNYLMRALSHSIMDSQNLWRIQHKAEKWIQDRFIIQDLCIPRTKSLSFIQEMIKDPGLFPMWLCPIKGTTDPQIFNPHLISKLSDEYFLNVGLYGLPSHSTSIQKITQELEKKTSNYNGRKVLYSRSYYTQNQFWEIYSRDAYETLRTKTNAKGIWHEITDKVLSE